MTMKVKYRASAHFDIETEIDIPDDESADGLAIWLAIIGDLENRYNLEIDILEVGEEYD